MCQFYACETETKFSGFCIVCGREVCPDCADKENPTMHTTCNFRNWTNWAFSFVDHIPTDVPMPG